MIRFEFNGVAVDHNTVDLLPRLVGIGGCYLETAAADGGGRAGQRATAAQAEAVRHCTRGTPGDLGRRWLIVTGHRQQGCEVVGIRGGAGSGRQTI